MTHERSKRVEASSSMAFLTGHLKGVDLEHANDVIDFLLGESISELACAEQVSNYVLLDISPMSLMAFLFDMIHHGLETG